MNPVILLDRVGYRFYHDRAGRPFLPPDRYAVRLVTKLEHLGEAVGPEIESVVGVPSTDEPAMRDAVRFLASSGGRPATRLVAVTERVLLAAAELREELGIAGPTSAELLPFRDKIVMKELLRGHGVLVPDFAEFSVDAARDLLATHGRVIAKPRLGTGAVDVHELTSDAAIVDFARVHAARLDEFEVEQFIPAQLCHVDSVVSAGRVAVAVASRYLDPTTSFLDLRPVRDVSAPPGQLRDRLLAFNAQVVGCFPGFSGVTHHEMFVAGEDIYLCEIAARAGGGGVIATFESRTGVNLDEAAVLAALTGEVPVPGPVDEHCAGWVVVYSGAGRLPGPVVLPDVPWILESQILARPGATLSPPANCNDAVAIVSVRGETEGEVVSRMAEITKLVSDSIVPID